MTPRRIKLGLIIGLSLLLFFGFFIINVVNYEVAKNSIRRGILNATLPLVSDNLYSEIQADLISPVEVSAMMANDTFLKDWILSGEKDIDLITKYLLAINKRYGYVSTFFVSERTGRYYHYKGLQKTISPEDEHDVWYYRFKKINVDYELDVDTDEAAKGRLDRLHQSQADRFGGEFPGRHRSRDRHGPNRRLAEKISRPLPDQCFHGQQRLAHYDPSGQGAY